VQRFDPHLALDGGPDGLDVYREIIAATAALAGAGTWCAVEAGAGQVAAIVALVGALCGARPAGSVLLREDLGCHTRCVAWKPRI
jgi:release factor glutamine methyltransferase